jgi:hypothetical protein
MGANGILLKRAAAGGTPPEIRGGARHGIPPILRPLFLSDLFRSGACTW